MHLLHPHLGDPTVRGIPRRTVDPLASLSPDERGVLEPALAGLANKVIARRLGVSERTVERRRASALRRLGVATIVEAAALYGTAVPGSPGGPPAPATFDAPFRVAAPAALVDRKGRFVAANAGICDALGFTERELLRMDYPQVVAASHDDAAAQFGRLMSGVSHAEPAVRIMRTAAGNLVRMSIAASAVWGPDGSPRFALGQVLAVEPVLSLAETS